MNNLFKKAIEQNTLLEFALGKAGFFIQDPELDEHWVLGGWKYHVVPLLNENRNACQYIVEMFARLTEAGQEPLGSRMDHLLHHVHVFNYLWSEGELYDCGDLFDHVESLVTPKLQDYCEAIAKEGDENRLKQLAAAISVVQKKGGLKRLAIEMRERQEGDT